MSCRPQIGEGVSRYLFHRYDIMKARYETACPTSRFMQLDGLHLNDFGQKYIGRLPDEAIS